jgi:hypothetical protein
LCIYRCQIASVTTLYQKTHLIFNSQRVSMILIYFWVCHSPVHLLYLEVRKSRINSNYASKVLLRKKNKKTRILTFFQNCFGSDKLYTCSCTYDMKGRNFKVKYIKQFKNLYYFLLILTANSFPLSFSGY